LKIRRVGKGALRAVPTIHPVARLMVGTLRFAHPTILSSSRRTPGPIPRDPSI